MPMMTIEQANFWGAVLPLVFCALAFIWFFEGWKKDAQARAQRDREERWRRAEERTAWEREEREYQRRRARTPEQRVADDVALAKRIRRERERTERRMDRALIHGESD
ncbi:hypothetical protein HOU00_gp186 [Caulobacter phage CcrPW]|uniref:Uncharacterized protein n=1 Tax=Caulobacter phage CcrPW TaxID=2283271 RepID=A0A385EE16_9CAUD|nr:hypothetical protein HOU00_gp186 [Caulobacter phage CcrPW]AXQ68939.1 hypothetical protein CcrPW_gp400 [Caulobacter phage CcrPW]